MKKFLAMVLAVAMVLCCAVVASAENEMAVAMVTDYGDITDQSFNQTTYEACKAFCEANGIGFQYYKPATDADAERISKIEQAIDDGYNVIVMPGYAFGPAMSEVVGEYPEVYFIALDVSEFDLGGITLPENAYTAVYQEELCGYMAGYAAVKLGYKHVGFLGGMAVPAVVRYGFGFVQGADAAAVEMNIADQVKIEYVYGNQFYGDADITAYMDNWYQNLGVEAVFACGGGIYSSAAEAAAKVGGKVIGVDVDQKATIDGTYGEGMTITSAMKGLAATVNTMLTKVMDGTFAEVGGQTQNLGLVSANPEENYVQIPMTTSFVEGQFTAEDYTALVAAMFAGEVTVSADISAMPATTVEVNDLGAIKG